MKARVATFALIFPLVFSPISFAQQPVMSAQEDYSGMYSFLREGEFVQITIEDGGKVSGFISRFGDSDSDKDTFLDQFFESGKLEGKHLRFTTKQVHGTWYTFDGNFGHGAGKSPEEEGYYVLRGTLTRFKTDVDKKTMQQAQRVELKSFPRDEGQ
jgi:hypothetical protein